MTTTRHKLFATWKNQVSLEQSLTLAALAVDAGVRVGDLFELSVCPSMTALASVAHAIANRIALTAQNMSWDDDRSLTGETTAENLVEIGCSYVILGHSERRRYLGEGEKMIEQKIQTAFAHQLTPILCVGESLEQHRAGTSNAVVQTQLETLSRNYPAPGAPFLIAYEPAWAISTSKNAGECEPDEAGERHSFIRAALANALGTKVATETTLLYGGNVTSGNADAYFTQPDIDGGLVGAASQEPHSLQTLIDATINTYQSQPARPASL